MKDNLNKVVTGARLQMFFTSPPQERKKITHDCLRKRRYSTIPEVKAVVDFYKQAENLTLRIYKCRHCSGYHLTKKTQKWNISLK
jgi:hypothetical protein